MKRRLSLAAIVVAALALLPTVAIAEARDDSSVSNYAYPSPWFLGLAVSSEGFGGDLGLPEGERLSLALVLDPFRGTVAVPSLAAGLSVPLFPWQPGQSLFEARLDLRLLTLRSPRAFGLYDAPAQYAPCLSASLYLPLYGDEPFGSLGMRPIVFRTGDAIYSLLSPAVVVSRGGSADGAYNFRGFSIELFEFTHFFR